MSRPAAIALMALLTAPAGATMKPAGEIMEWKGAFCRQAGPTVIVARSPGDWAKVWDKIGKPAPAVDFKRFFAVAVFAGQRPTGGYSISWQESDSLIRYRVVRPKGMAIQAITQPYDVRLFPSTGGPVKVEALPGD